MEFIGKYHDFNFNPITQKKIISFECDEINQEEINNLVDKELKIEVKRKTNRRSLNANAYAWVLMGKLASKMNPPVTKEHIYLEMLKRYSNKCCYIIVREEVIPDFAKEWRTFVDLGEINVNGTKGHQLQCFFGSSTFDSKEMAVFLDGIISECVECGIDVRTPSQIKELKELWRLENE